MTFLLGYWRYLAIALFVAAYTGFVYHAGGNPARAELKALQTASDAYKAISKRIAQEKDDEYHKELAAIQSDWDRYRLLHPATKVPRLVTNLCSAPADNDAVSAAIGDYLDAVGRFRAETSQLLEQASKQQAQLNCVTDWAQTINR